MGEGRTLARLGGYDAIAAVCNDLLPRLMGDERLGRFWQNRAEDSIAREKQLLILQFTDYALLSGLGAASRISWVTYRISQADIL
jgi:hypothetical protein